LNIEWHNEKRAIKDLVPYVANPRQITEKQAKDLKASLERFGVADPIIINTDNTIIGGHQRKKILETLMGVDPDYEIDVRIPDRELGIDEMRELNVRLNKNQGEWNFDTLANNFDLDDLLDWGFEKSDLDLDLWMPDPPDDAEPQIDRAEELREIWGVESGQLWQLGEHRLICGDCTDRGVVERVMGGEKAVMMFTDPPWNVAIGKDSNPRHRQRDGLENDNMTPEKYFAFVSAFVSAFVENVSGDVYCVLGASEWPKLDLHMRKQGFHWSATIIWVKDIFVLGRSKYHRRYEPIWYGWHNGGTSSFNGKRDLDDVWEFDRPKRSDEHPTMKPVELVEMAIQNSSAIGDSVFEPFCGSGTDIIACERLNRKCRAVEISPAYVAVAIQRWVDVTGGEPVLVE
jgi:DNA modification methylase